MDESSTLTKLKLLTWKYLCFRKFHWILTLVEILLTIIFVYVCMKIVEQLVGRHVTQGAPSEQAELTVNQILKSVKYNSLHYTPNNDKTMEISKCAVDMINEHRKDTPIKNRSANTENLLMLAMAEDAQQPVGIVYQATGDLFEYKIRDKRTWNTSDLFVEHETVQNGPYFPDPYYETGFIGLQYIVDRCYIKARVQEFKSQAAMDLIVTKASFQGLPYPEYTDRGYLLNFTPMFTAFTLIVSSFMLLCPLIHAIIQEKTIGIKEIMKIAGLPGRFLWVTWYVYTLIFALFVYFIISLLLRNDLRGSDYATIRHVQPALLWILLVLFFASQMSFAFTFCALFHSSLFAISSFCIITILLGYLSMKVHDWQNYVLVRMSCLFPVGAFIQTFKRIAYYEMLEIPLTWSHVSFTSISDVSLGFIMIMFVVDIFLYLLLTYYLDAVNPGKYGYQRSLFFFVENERNKQKLKFEAIIKAVREKDAGAVTDAKNPFVEQPSQNSEVIIKLKDLHKKYGPIDAVKGVDLSMFKNEIFVLLGNDKTGKTTLLSMMSGLVEPTQGTILYRGNIDLLRNIKEFRKQLGFCPQQNRLLPYMTIMDHLIFYGMLKGSTKTEAVEEASAYLKLMGIFENAEDLTSVISDEMKRKLCLTIALMGKSEILILDEPTSGLDFISKNRIWSLLIKLKKDHTIMLTTTGMKEASAVADRIAIMNNGVIVCNGSIPFLENAFATGYELRLKRKKPNADTLAKMNDVTPKVIELIMKSAPGSKVLIQTTTEIVFKMPSNNSSKFPALFKYLESRKASIYVDYIGVSYTTLEKIFLKIGGGSFYDATGKPLKLSALVEEALEIKTYNKEKMTGVPLLLAQHQALFLKRYIFTYRNWVLFLYRVLVPTVLIVVLIWGTNIFDRIDPPLPLTTASYPESTILALKDRNYTMDTEFHNQFLLYLSEKYIPYREVLVDNSTKETLMNLARNNIKWYRQNLLAAGQLTNESNEGWKFKMFYNKFARHSLPVALNTIDNIMYVMSMKKQHAQIVTHNHPIKVLNRMKVQSTDIAEHSPILTVFYVLLAFFTIDLLDYIAIPVKAERVDGFKNVQFLSGVEPFTYWLNTFIFDFVLVLGIMILRISLFKSFDYYGFFTLKNDFDIAILLIVLFIISGLLFMYSLSFVLNSRFGAYQFFFLCNVICTFLAFAFYNFQISMITNPSSWSVVYAPLSILKYIVLLIPPFNFSVACVKFIRIWRINHIVQTRAASNFVQSYVQYQANNTTRPTAIPYVKFPSAKNPNGILHEIIFLFLDIILYGGVIYMVESSRLKRLFDRSYSDGSKKTPKDDMNKEMIASRTIPDDVLKEREKTQELIKTLSEPPPTGKMPTPSNKLVAHDLKKVYGSFLKATPKTAVENATFIVPEGECFGILGLKSSGGTSTLKMLTGEIRPTKGDSWIGNLKLSKKRAEYRTKIGYCPQTDFIMEELSGKETLFVVAALRGIPEFERRDIIEKWVTVLGLESVINKLCSTYDEGNRRKICVAVAFIGDPNVIMLDEPTSNIDPVSRRSLYALIGRMKATGRAVIVSSHSMQECETLCDRLTILVKGEMKFIGTPDELRKKYAQALSLLIILNDLGNNDTDETRLHEIEQLKFLVKQKFRADSCVVLTETKLFIQYEITEMMTWGDAFQRMEDLKKSVKFMKDYQLSEKLLEDVLISLSKTADE